MWESGKKPYWQFGKVAKRAGAVASEVQRPTGVFRAPSLSALSEPNNADDGPAGLEWKKNIEPCLFTGLFLGIAWGDCAWSIWIVMRRVRANRQVQGKDANPVFAVYGGLAGNMWKKTRRQNVRFARLFCPTYYGILSSEPFDYIMCIQRDSLSECAQKKTPEHSLKTTAPI